MYVCMYVTYVCTYSRYVFGWAISESVNTCTYTNVCICVIMFMPIYAHMYICEFVCMYVCVFMSIVIMFFVFLRVFRFMNFCMHVHVCVSVYT